MSRELVTITAYDEGVKVSNGSSINYKLYKYIYNYIRGYLVYDVLESYRSECQIIDNDNIIVPVELLQLFKSNVITITDALEKVQGKMNRDIWKASDMLTLRITTKPVAITPATPASNTKSKKKAK